MSRSDGGASQSRKRSSVFAASAVQTEESHFPAPRRAPKPLRMLEITCLFKRRHEGVRVAGRPASESGISNQGRHATAFALVKKGFIRWFASEDDREVKKSVLDYVEKLSVLQRLPGMDGAPVDKRQAEAGEEDAPVSSDAICTDGLSGELHQCVGDVLQVYGETRIHRRHLRHSKRDLEEGSSIASAMHVQDMQDILEVVASSRNRAGNVVKKECIVKLVELFGARLSRGNKKAVTKNFGESLQSLLEPLHPDEIFGVAQAIGLDRVSRRYEDIKSQQDANSVRIYDTCETLAELSVAYYNRMRGVAFNSADTYDYPPGRIDEATSLRYLDDRYGSGVDWSEDLEWKCSFVQNLTESIAVAERQIARKRKQLNRLREGDPKRETLEEDLVKKREELQGAREKLANSPDLIKALDGLFDYPAVKREVGEVAEDPGERDGSIEKLVFLMARHLHIAFSVYPEAVQRYGPDYLTDPHFRREVLQPFVGRVLSRGWSEVIDEEDYRDISSRALQQMMIFSKPNMEFRKVRENHESSSSDSNPTSDGSTRGASGSDHDDEPDTSSAMQGRGF